VGAEFGTDEDETSWERILEREREFLGFVQCFFL
jgi:hypothetical protein